MNKRDLILRLHDIEAIKFGTFTLKSGIVSPIYIDLRLIVSYPLLLKSISEYMWNEISHLEFELLCGVPYTALPIATAMSLSQNIPMVMRRKEAKDYGTKRVIEGTCSPGQRCVIVEDLVTSGSSILETYQPLKKEGLVVKDAIVLIDREQGGRKNLQEWGITLHSVMDMNDILETLSTAHRLQGEQLMEVKDFIHENQIYIIGKPEDVTNN